MPTGIVDIFQQLLTLQSFVRILTLKERGKSINSTMRSVIFEKIFFFLSSSFTFSLILFCKELKSLLPFTFSFFRREAWFKHTQESFSLGNSQQQPMITAYDLLWEWKSWWTILWTSHIEIFSFQFFEFFSFSHHTYSREIFFQNKVAIWLIDVILEERIHSISDILACQQDDAKRFLLKFHAT